MLRRSGRTRRTEPENATNHTNMGSSNENHTTFQGSIDNSGTLQRAIDGHNPTIGPIQTLQRGASLNSVSGIMSNFYKRVNVPLPRRILPPPIRPQTQPIVPHLRRGHGSAVSRHCVVNEYKY
jgi:hypothetical protein